jgi:large subunit ribosomal protein L1
VYGTISRAKPAGVKGNFIKSASLCTTMGPGIKIDVPALEALAKEAVS